MKWEHHYTGIDFVQKYWGKLELYLQRDTHNKRLRFIRVSVPRHMLCLHIGRGNYVKGDGGWEVSTGNHHIGWSTVWNKIWGKPKFYRVDYSGSFNDPYSSFTIRLGRLGFGGRSPKWLKARKDREAEQAWAAMEPPPGYFDYDDNNYPTELKE
jgi:hypothetical protein